MTRLVPLKAVWAALVLAALCLAAAPRSAWAQQAPSEGRQVTVFGVRATPGVSPADDDPKLKDVLPQLRALAPGYNFKLIKVESKRLATNQFVSCDLGDGFVAETKLLTPVDPNGKIQLHFQLTVNGLPQYQTIYATPANQIFYANRMLGDGTRLLIGVGAR